MESVKKEGLINIIRISLYENDEIINVKKL